MFFSPVVSFSPELPFNPSRASPRLASPTLLHNTLRDAPHHTFSPYIFFPFFSANSSIHLYIIISPRKAHFYFFSHFSHLLFFLSSHFLFVRPSNYLHQRYIVIFSTSFSPFNFVIPQPITSLEATSYFCHLLSTFFLFSHQSLRHGVSWGGAHCSAFQFSSPPIYSVHPSSQRHGYTRFFIRLSSPSIQPSIVISTMWEAVHYCTSSCLPSCHSIQNISQEDEH